MATTGDPTRRNRTRDALDHKPDATGADSEAAQAEKSSVKKGKKEKVRKGQDPAQENTCSWGAKAHTLVLARLGDMRRRTRKSSGIKNYKKTRRKNQPPYDAVLFRATQRRRNVNSRNVNEPLAD